MNSKAEFKSNNLEKNSVMKKKNTIIIILSLVLSCLCIPAGIWHDYSSLEVAINMVVLIVALLIAGLNNEYFFKAVPEAKMGYYLGRHLLTYLMLFVGFLAMIGSFGDAYWLRFVGGALLIAGGFYTRTITKKVNS